MTVERKLAGFLIQTFNKNGKKKIDYEIKHTKNMRNIFTIYYKFYTVIHMFCERMLHKWDMYDTSLF